MERKTKVGMLEVILDDRGMAIQERKDPIPGDQYIATINEDKSIWISQDGVEKLKNWLDDDPGKRAKKIINDVVGNTSINELFINGKKSVIESKKSIDYKDRSYIDKRRILRQLSIKDEIDCFLDIVTDDIVDNLKHYPNIKEVKNTIDIESVDFWNNVRNFLIDGYLAYEIIFDDKSKPIALNQLDPVSLVVKMEGNKKVWIQYPEDQFKKRILNDSQIIYLMYSDNSSKTSYVEELKESYERLKIAENHLFFPKDDPGKIDLRINNDSIKLLSECLNRVSRIPDLMINHGVKSENLRYQRFINKLVSIFIEKMFNKLIELNK
jgi:hypothetical protein